MHCAIVAAGEPAASPHHEPGSRVIRSGEIVLCDFGGTMNGYCSDITRCVFTGDLRSAAPDIAEAYGRCGLPPVRSSAPGFAGLIRMIAGQQVSVQSAAAIIARLEARVAPLTADRGVEVIRVERGREPLVVGEGERVAAVRAELAVVGRIGEDQIDRGARQRAAELRARRARPPSGSCNPCGRRSKGLVRG